MEVCRVIYSGRLGEKKTYLPTIKPDIADALFGVHRNRIISIEPLNELEVFFLKLQCREPGQREVCDLFQALGQLFSLGVDPVGGLNLLIRRMKNIRLASKLLDVSQAIQQGEPIADAFSRYAQLFGETSIHLIRAGAATGNLGRAFENLADNMTKTRTIARRIQAALAYPTVVLAVIYAVILIFCFMVVPKLAEIYAQFGGQLPLATRILQAMSIAFISNWWLTLIIPAMGVAIFLQREKIGHSKLFNNILRKLPGIKGFVWKRNLTQVSGTLALLLESGLPLTESLEYSSRVVSDPIMMQIFVEIKERLEEGELVNEAFAEYVDDLGPDGPRLIMAVEVGDATGSLAPLIAKIARALEEEFDIAAQNLNRLLEPVVIVILATVVGFLVYAIYYPIFTLGQTMIQSAEATKR
ncbi:MAG: type II secretion system F family protein [bacterium]